MRIFFLLFLFNYWVLYAQDYDSYLTGSSIDLDVEAQGGVCLMGGASESDEAMTWFLNQANGGDVLVLRASGSDGYNDYMYTDLGVSLNSVETIVFNNASASNETYIHDKIKGAEAIWFAGGDQWDYISFWRDSPIDSLINDAIINRNIVIGGTSAGMAIQGGIYFSAENGTITSSTALANPFDDNCTVDTSSFLANDILANVITDTHYDSPDRKGRHTVFIAWALDIYGLYAKGIACEEYTAVCIGTDGVASIYGGYPTYDDFAYFIAPNCQLADQNPEAFVSTEPLTWNHGGEALKVYKVPGTSSGTNTFDLNTWNTGTGGEWLHWSVNAGVFTEAPGTAPNCSLGGEDIFINTGIYPNPTTGLFTINHMINTQVFITDLNGKEVFTTVQDECDLSNLERGFYLVHYTDFSGGNKVEKVVLR
ncbi:MAG: Type 1 glutamine amidotransferase-like domain-containing protein [Crocinitomicaceae bacterium]|nr:Type 1 glutamine amidotransferase-like domain-containing protein [Crocinitomicaceae bacterium]